LGQQVRIERPATLDEAVALLQQEPAARPLGGGTAIQILRRQGLVDPPVLVDLAPLAELQGIREENGSLRIGAMVTHREVERSALVESRTRLLCETYRRVGNVRVRHTATVGGNLAHGDYRLDPPAALLALEASVTIAGPGGPRSLAMRDFFVDLLETALQPAEVILSVNVPLVHASRSSAFEKFSSLAANDWPCVAVAAVLDWDDSNGALLAARLGVTAMAPTPLLIEVPDLTGMTEAGLADAAVQAVLAVVDPLPDLRGSADYKRRACAAVVRDVVARAWRRDREVSPAR
jgi:carbon-monoxide dehydrogenase medium subunit